MLVSKTLSKWTMTWWSDDIINARIIHIDRAVWCILVLYTSPPPSWYQFGTFDFFPNPENSWKRQSSPADLSQAVYLLLVIFIGNHFLSSFRLSDFLLPNILQVGREPLSHQIQKYGQLSIIMTQNGTSVQVQKNNFFKDCLKTSEGKTNGRFGVISITFLLLT